MGSRLTRGATVDFAKELELVADDPREFGPRLEGDMLHFLSGSSVYSEPMLRRASDAIFGVDVLQIGGGGTGSLVVKVQHRNQFDDTWTTAATFAAITHTGLHTNGVGDLKELVRLELTLKFVTSPFDKWMRVFVVPPVWEA